MLYAGSMVFLKPRHRVDLGACNWWHFLRGADQRHPLGPESSIQGLDKHPAVHVAYRDVEAYAKWAGKELPAEAEWEFAARGGRDGADYAWGDELHPAGRHMANTWQGEFPWQNLRSDGYERTSPVDAFPPNAYGLLDMIGNVWEWTTDWYDSRHTAGSHKACCVPHNPRGGLEEASYDLAQPQLKIPRKVLKGGSHLCAPNYCRRYRPAARYAHPVDTSTCHIGFRCIVRPRQN
jgi:formylglycine-generating enzyme required for sulfatase activity